MALSIQEDQYADELIGLYTEDYRLEVVWW
jgi:hypothetical protein